MAEKEKNLIGQDDGKKYRCLVILSNGKRRFEWRTSTGGHLL